jgi:O-antigen/teichoic acid export membrane protein
MPDMRTERLVGARNILRNSSVVLLGDLVLTIGRLIIFLLLARAFGITEMGVYVSVLAMVQLFFPAAQWGTSHIAIRRIASGGSVRIEWQQVVGTTLRFGTLLIGICTLTASIFFDVNLPAVALIAAAQLIAMTLQGAAQAITTGQGRPERGLLINACSTVSRLSAALLFTLRESHDLIDWAVLFFGASAISVFLTLWIMADGRRPLISGSRSSAADLREGSGYVFAQGASTAQADIDKVVLGAYGLSNDTGAYAAAYRITDLATVPLTALVSTTYSEFFRRGQRNLQEARRYAVKLTAVATGYGLVAGAVLFVAAPWITLLVGDEYAESVEVVRYVALIPAVKATQFFPGNVLTGTGRQWWRARAMWSTAIMNAAANIVLAPMYGWRGAVVATYVTEVVFSALLWWLVRRARIVGGKETADEEET